MLSVHMSVLHMSALDVDLSSNRFREQSCAPVWCSLKEESTGELQCKVVKR